MPRSPRSPCGKLRLVCTVSIDRIHAFSPCFIESRTRCRLWPRVNLDRRRLSAAPKGHDNTMTRPLVRAPNTSRKPVLYEQSTRLLRFISTGPTCPTGRLSTPDFLNAVQPSFGLGINFSQKPSRSHASAFRTCNFVCTRIMKSAMTKYSIMCHHRRQRSGESHAPLRALRRAMHNETRLIIDNYNHLSEPIIRLAEHFG